MVFDLDDTLIREREYCRDGFRRIEKYLTSNKIDGLQDEDFRGISEKMDQLLTWREPYFDYLEERLREKGMESLMPQLVEMYRNNDEADLKIIPGMKEMLEELSRRGTVIGIITDGRSKTQRIKIQRSGIDRYMDPENILISEETGKDKKSASNFRHFVSRYPEAHRFYYIGDNERKDFFIPNLLGWTTYKVKWDSDNVQEEYENSDKMQRASAELENPMDFLELNGTK